MSPQLPNVLTVLRIVLTFVIMGLLFMPGLAARWACLILFLIAAFTDWLDGYLARRAKTITPLGVLLDPIADKILVLGLLLVFVQFELVRAWMVLLIVLRELMVTGMRMYAASRHHVIAATAEGKQKAFTQMATICTVLVALLLEELSAAQGTRWPGVAFALIDWGMAITVALTMWSGAVFIWRNRAMWMGASERNRT
jgi:CDP-diacylglycerol--glycerol-3-phosphate 3-phosphatidyltransferase